MRELRPCDVHVLVDGDSTPRDCGYCEICKSWMCEPCRADFVRRTAAAGIRGMEEFKAAVKRLLGRGE